MNFIQDIFNTLRCPKFLKIEFFAHFCSSVINKPAFKLDESKILKDLF